ncbi:MAG: beta galactosidase jelly roll domain-containing protein, partial [Vallitaleaceae bacterium]|nr:beta galactosidase jelly roll domain-containing protein [Vallitaleaceae bacterium]
MIQKMLNKNWKFLLDDPLRADRHNFWDKGYDDRAWKSVTLPHDWSVEYPFSEEFSSGTGYVTGGIAWYRLRFSLPEEVRGKKLFLHFDGVYKNSQVWMNSYYLGKRPNGYTSFSYDISEQACFGSLENVIVVKVSHTDLADSRWFTGSGIYRKVYLTVQDEVYLENDSLFFQAKEVSEKSAVLEIQTTISNDCDHEEEVILRHELKDVEQKVVLQKEFSLALKAKESRMNVLQETLEKPKLWSDKEVNLYQLTTTLVYHQEERVVDQRKVGIRKIAFDPNSGFFINDVNMKLKGVCVHHDAGALGAAVTANVWKRRLEKLKAMGCNAIRCSHNPHMPELYELCDEMGFYVIDEAFDEWEGPKNKWST